MLGAHGGGMETLIDTRGRHEAPATDRSGSRTPVAAILAAAWALLALGLSLAHLAGLEAKPWGPGEASALRALSTTTVAVLVAVLALVSLSALALGHRRGGRPAVVSGVLLLATGLIVALALRGGLNPNDLKLITAFFVFVALVLPGFLRQVKRPRMAGS